MVALVQPISREPGQQRARALLLGKHEILDLDNAGHRVPGIAKELQAHGTGVAGHAVHHPTRACDQSVAAFFLNARQTGKKLVGDILAQPRFTEMRTGDVE